MLAFSSLSSALSHVYVQCWPRERLGAGRAESFKRAGGGLSWRFLSLMILGRCLPITAAARTLGLKRGLVTVMVAAATVLGFVVPARSEPAPALVELPAAVAASNPDLASRRAALAEERETLHGQVNALNARCRSVEVGSAVEAACLSDKAALLPVLQAHIDASNAFNALAATVGAAPAPEPIPVPASAPAPTPEPVPTAASMPEPVSPPAAEPVATPVSPAPAVEPVATSVSPAPAERDAGRLRVTTGMEALAKTKHWSAEKTGDLDQALRALEITGLGASPEAIRQTWHDILAQSDDADLARDASEGGGLGMAGAGGPPRNGDCAIFGLAKAADLPYGVVAARATALISDASWRSDKQRANPQSTFEKGGLTGAEMVMLSETFGQVEVVPTTSFSTVLADGRTIVAAVALPRDGDDRIEREMLFAKSFQHGGETWYVVMDSSQGPIRRLFLSQGQLNIVLTENGIAFRPEVKAKPRSTGFQG
jgi:hypothetical protein